MSHEMIFSDFPPVVKFDKGPPHKMAFKIPPPQFTRISELLETTPQFTEPVATPDWTPNTATYQQPLYPPSQALYSPRPTMRATIARKFKYRDPILTPIENLKHLRNMNPPVNIFDIDYNSITVCAGKLARESVAYSTFMRDVETTYHAGRGVPTTSVLFMMKQIENFCSFNRVEWALISKSKLIDFLNEPIITKIKQSDILFCLGNREEVTRFIESPGHLFRCKDGPAAVAAHLARIVRTKLIRKHHLSVIKARRAAERIIRMRKKILTLRNIDFLIQQKIDAHRPKALELMQNLKRDWSEKYEGKIRIAIHLPSVSSSKEMSQNMGDLKVKQSMQFGRFRDLLDPNVTVIYISHGLTEEILGMLRTYLQNFFFNRNFENDQKIMERIHIVEPETAMFYPRTVSLTSILLTSSKAMRKIITLVGNTPAYIVPGIVGELEEYLSATLNIPLFSNFAASKSFAFNITNQTNLISRCDVAAVPTENVESSSKLSAFLSKFAAIIKDNEFCKRWFLKLNKHSNQFGLAYWDLNSNVSSKISAQTFEAQILESIIETAKIVNSSSVECDQIIRKCVHELFPKATPEDITDKKTKQEKSRPMEEFLAKLITYGGVIQAAPPVAYENEYLKEERVHNEFPTRFPAVHLLIQPNCESKEDVQLICTSDSLCITPYRWWGVVVPQQTCDGDELVNAAKCIADGLLHLGYWGYASIEFVSWDNNEEGIRNLWCIGVKPYLSLELAACMNYLTATYTKFIPPGNFKSGTTMLDLNRARRIEFEYLHQNKFIDLERVKKAAHMAAFDGDEDLAERVGIYSPNFQHFGLSVLTSISIETMCLDSGFDFDLKTKIGALTLNSDRESSLAMSMMFVNESFSGCLEQVLKLLPVLYKRLMTMEMEENSNFIDIATTIIPELRRSRHRETLFRNDKKSQTDGVTDNELYPVHWRHSKDRLHFRGVNLAAAASNFEFAINIEQADSSSNSHMFNQAPITRKNSLILSAEDMALLGFSSTKLSPTMNIAKKPENVDDLNIFVGSADTATISLLTNTENQHITKRMAANRLEEVIVLSRALDLPDYTDLGIQEFNPINRLRLVAAHKANEAPPVLPAVMPDPKSIALLNSLIPSNSLWAKYEDYGEIEDEPTPFKRQNEKIPLGLPVEKYLALIEKMTEDDDIRDEFERQRKEQMERARLKEEERKKKLLEEQRMLAELDSLIAAEKEAWIASGKPVSKKLLDDIEAATRRQFFEKQIQDRESIASAPEIKKIKLRLKDFMGKYCRDTVGGTGLDVENRSLEKNLVAPSDQENEIQKERQLRSSTIVPSFLLRDIGESLLGLRGFSMIKMKNEIDGMQFRNYKRTLNLLLLLGLATGLALMLLSSDSSSSAAPNRSNETPKTNLSFGRSTDQIAKHENGGVNLPPFLSEGRGMRDQPKMDFVKEMMRHAWAGYVKYAWGADDLNPISKTAHNWYGNSTLLNTPVDSLDTLLIMGMDAEYAEARDLVLGSLDFDAVDAKISVFETTIRVLGGLLSAYDLSGDEKLLKKAVDLADRFLPVFDSPTGIPHNFINLKSGEVDKSDAVVLSELGSLQLEFQYLSDVTGNTVYAEKALYVYDQMQLIKTIIPGVFPDTLRVSALVTLGSKIGLGGRCDSYYEYLLKLWLSTGVKKYFDMYYVAAESIVNYMTVKADAGHYYIPAAYVRNPNGNITIMREDIFEHLTCFAGGMFATGALASRKGNWTSHLHLGSEITETCWKMYNNSATGIGSENANGKTLRLGFTQYFLRPEAIESLFYMWRFTHDEIYRERAWVIVQNYETYCRGEVGYHGLLNAASITTGFIDRQESFFLAETLKYLYLIFAEDDLIPLEKYVFNTEAHPLSVRGHGRRSDSTKFTPIPPNYRVPVGVVTKT